MSGGPVQPPSEGPLSRKARQRIAVTVHACDGDAERANVRAGALARSAPGSQPRWQSIEVRHLIALSAVARERSFNRAADQLGYVQSAISGQIAHLERAVGTRLLERASGTAVVELTDAGRLLLLHADEILSRYDTARMAVASTQARPSGSLRVAGLERLGPRRTAEILGAFRRLRPFTRIMLDDPAGAEARLADGSLDVVVQEGAVGARTVVVGQLDFVLLVRHDSELASHRGSLTLGQLRASHPMVPGPRACSPVLRAQLEEHGIERNDTITPGSAAVVQGLVAGGLGPAVVPRTWQDPAGARTIALDLSHLLKPSAITVTIGAAGDRRAGVVELFIDVVRETAGDRKFELAC